MRIGRRSARAPTVRAAKTRPAIKATRTKRRSAALRSGTGSFMGQAEREASVASLPDGTAPKGMERRKERPLRTTPPAGRLAPAKLEEKRLKSKQSVHRVRME